MKGKMMSKMTEKMEGKVRLAPKAKKEMDAKMMHSKKMPKMEKGKSKIKSIGGEKSSMKKIKTY